MTNENCLDLLLEKVSKPHPIEIPPKAEIVLEEMQRYSVENPRMRNVTRELGELLYVIAKDSMSKNIVEVGTSNGYSTIWIALAAKENGGKITTFENQEWKVEQAKQNFDKSGITDLVTVVIGDAQKLITKVEGQIDLLFLDILPEDYLTCIKESIPKMNRGSIVVCDNLLNHRDREGNITPRGEEGNDYLRFAKENFNGVSPILNVGSGVQICII